MIPLNHTLLVFVLHFQLVIPQGLGTSGNNMLYFFII